MLSGQYLFHHQREESLERQVFGGGGKPRIPVFGLRHNLKTSGTTSIQASKAPAQLEASKPPAQLEASKPPAQLQFKLQNLRHNLPSSLKSCEKGWGRPKRDWEDIGTNCNARKGCHAVMMPEYRTQGNRNISNLRLWIISEESYTEMKEAEIWIPIIGRVCERWNSMVDEGVRLHPFYKLLQVNSPYETKWMFKRNSAK